MMNNVDDNHHNEGIYIDSIFTYSQNYHLGIISSIYIITIILQIFVSQQVALKIHPKVALHNSNSLTMRPLRVNQLSMV